MQWYYFVIDKYNIKISVGIKKSPYLPNNVHGILSTNQSGEVSIWVGDILLRHGNNQSITQINNQGLEWKNNLQSHESLLSITCIYLPDSEMEVISEMWLINDKKPWDTSTLSDENLVIMPLFGPKDKDTYYKNQVNINDLRKEQKYIKRMNNHQLFTKAVAYHTRFSFLTRFCCNLSKGCPKNPD